MVVSYLYFIKTYDKSWTFRMFNELPISLVRKVNDVLGYVHLLLSNAEHNVMDVSGGMN